MQFHAHSGRRDDRSDWEPLPDHLLAVATTAERFGAPLGIGAACRLAGLLHDLGKFDPAFQRRLTDDRIRVDHSTAGAAAVLEHWGMGPEREIAWLVAQAIAGHHAGLPDRRSDSDAALESRVKTFRPDVLDPASKSMIPAETARLVPSFRFDKVNLPYQFAMLGRMIFSCLVDADFKETERFYISIGERQKDRDWPALADRLPMFLDAFDRRIAAFGQPEKDLAKLRADILATVRERAAMAPGLFTLNVPTGGGKTLASLGFALDHAKRHGHRRIIVSIPFTSIIDQTAAIFRQVLGEGNVLEHHSAIEEERRDLKGSEEADAPEADSNRAMREKMRLAMEDWAAPIVVTTHVQLFESLFAARTGRSRKLHNIAGSVLVLDEAQVMPRHLLAPTARAIDELAKNWGCSIVLCTATQPAFDARNFPTPDHPLALGLEGRELAPDPARLARALKRNRLVHAGEMSDDALVDALEDHPQALVIVNSRRHALDLYNAAKARGLDGMLHLTTRQYAAHRREILEDVRQRLERKKPCRLIATSLIEAGVDVDFPVAWRAEAGLDSIAQAAGRVNREGRRPIESSVVTVFKPADPDHKPPKEIEGLVADMARIMGKHEDLFSPDAIADYFGETYWRVGPEGLDREKILGMMAYSGNQGIDVAYRTIAEKYRMIEMGMLPVIVAIEPEVKKAVAELEIERIPSGAIARRLQLYLVQTPRNAVARLLAAGAVTFEQPGKRGDQFAVLRNDDLYTKEKGLLWDDPDYRRDENMIL